MVESLLLRLKQHSGLEGRITAELLDEGDCVGESESLFYAGWAAGCGSPGSMQPLPWPRIWSLTGGLQAGGAAPILQAMCQHGMGPTADHAYSKPFTRAQPRGRASASVRCSSPQPTRCPTCARLTMR